MVLFIFSSIFTWSASSNVYASSQIDDYNGTEIETEGVSDLFVNFIDKALTGVDVLCITDSNGKDVTNKYAKQFTKYYALKDYKSIQELIKNDELLVSYKVREVDVNTQSNTTPQSFTTEHFSQSFYHNEYDLDRNFPEKEWLSTINGSAVVDPNNGKIISASKPTLKVDARFGSAFDVDVKNISTGYTIHTSTIDYYASYHITATVTVPIGDFEVGYEVDFGNHYDKFTAYPAF